MSLTVHRAAPKSDFTLTYINNQIKFDLNNKKKKKLKNAGNCSQAPCLFYMKLISGDVLILYPKVKTFRLNNPQFSHVLPSGVLCIFKFINW